MKKFVDKLKIETYSLYLACKDPRTPWYVKLLAGSIVAYALSPIDFIPDFIPIIGYLDDAVLIPLGLVLVRKLINPEVLAECRQKAIAELGDKCLVSYWAAAVIVVIWILLFGLIILSVARYFWFDHHG